MKDKRGILKLDMRITPLRRRILETAFKLFAPKR